MRITPLQGPKTGHGSLTNTCLLQQSGEPSTRTFKSTFLQGNLWNRRTACALPPLAILS